MGEQDASYRRLFEHSALLRDLLACVLDVEWVARLDWTRLSAVNGQYVGDRLEQRRADGVWRIPLLPDQPTEEPRPPTVSSGESSRCKEAPGKPYSPGQRHGEQHGAQRPEGQHDPCQQPDGRHGAEEVYVLLMLENQSQPEQTMALRMAAYAALLYQSLLRQKLLTLPLPPILPVVLYSGRRPWRASVDMAALLDLGVSDLSGYQLQMRYLLVDEGKLLREGGLPDRNLAALLFRLQHSDSIEKLREILHTLKQVLRGPQYAELNRSFAIYIRHVVLSRAQPKEPLPMVTDLQEIAMMISEKPGLWARQWEKEGIQKGLLEGRQQGLQKGRQQGRLEGLLAGQAGLLERLLQRKFGVLPQEVVDKVRQGSESQLETWSLNFVDADTLDQVFGD